MVGKERHHLSWQRGEEPLELMGGDQAEQAAAAIN
jgi:hypothetical protein